jgi:hypothetical protein
MHGLGGGVLAPVVQQKSVEPPLALPRALQERVLSIWSGVFEPAHENPYESPLHPETA